MTPDAWLDSVIASLANLLPSYVFLSDPVYLRGLLAVLPVCIVCGVVGSLVVGNRMAFFSDALAHCAFAGVALGLLSGVLAGAVPLGAYYHWGVPAIMIAFGILMGVSIVFVREKTGLANDTVIGVFFAGAIGFGAMLLQPIGHFSTLRPDTFLFGNPVWVRFEDFLSLFILTILTLAVLAWIYNRLVFASFNVSLARSRQIPLRLFNYMFVVLLALIVNLSLKSVGALLINAMLIVPAATAGNLSRNLRQMFWLSVGLSVGAGFCGAWIASAIQIPNPAGGRPISFGWGGTIVVLSMLLFFLSMVAGRWFRGVQSSA
jgi:zinc transport system permease protein